MATAKKKAAGKKGAKESCCEESAREKGRREEGPCEEGEARAESGVHEADDAVRSARAGRRCEPDAAHRSHQEALAVHQEEQPAGSRRIVA